MARESIEQRRARLAPGAAWLTAERERRGLSGRELARRLGINADRIFAYERSQDEPGKDFISMLAAEYGMTEVDVWRGLGKALPAEFETDEALDDYYESKYPDVFKGVERRTGAKVTSHGGKQQHTRDRRRGITRRSDSPDKPSQERASGA
jgi:transcriptional regulator with XRE-family HTH domain